MPEQSVAAKQARINQETFNWHFMEVSLVGVRIKQLDLEIGWETN